MSSSSGNLGRQGGDRSGREHLVIDLASCVNRYGPPVAVRTALESLPLTDLTAHPYEAAGLVRSVYAAHLRVPETELQVHRGISGAIWTLAASELASEVYVALPGYTEYLQAFPDPARWLSAAADSTVDLELVEHALTLGSAVVLSNPNNPTSALVPPAILADIARACPKGTLIVDESYVDFADERASLLSLAPDNVVILRSPSKFYGIPGARVGISWTRSADVARIMSPQLGSWPVSMIEARLAAVALASQEWAVEMQCRIRSDVEWLAARLATALVARPAANFVLVAPGRLDLTRLERHGVGGRALGVEHGLPFTAVRLTAPRSDERAAVAEALG